MLIESRDNKGGKILFNSDQVVSIVEAGTSSQWHGTRTIIKLTSGQILECGEAIDEITAKINGGSTLLNG